MTEEVFEDDQRSEEANNKNTDKIALLLQNENFLSFFTGMIGVIFVVSLTHVMAFIQSGSFETIGGVNLALSFAFSSLLIGYHIGEIRSPTKTESMSIAEKIKNGYLVLGIFVGIVISILVLLITLDSNESKQVAAISGVAILGIIFTFSANLAGLITRYDESEAYFERGSRFLSGLGIYQFIQSSLLGPVINRFLDGDGTLVDLIFLLAFLGVILLLVDVFIFDISGRYQKLKIERSS